MTNIIARFHKTLEANANVLTVVGLALIAFTIAVNTVIH